MPFFVIQVGWTLNAILEKLVNVYDKTCCGEDCAGCLVNGRPRNDLMQATFRARRHFTINPSVLAMKDSYNRYFFWKGAQVRRIREIG